ncbi:hypothetical protein [Aquamicrobium sp. LC103]|uniref:hypothetical protein n=1 Tax=Aquamicrobium sp. LC103 TaxID=1120658 RepID=UPI00063EA6E5|nr:hypothetical protein [Aquamicrobium sp. LC103]TKT82837.1 hypothetical protein XW59_002420 [Aquamicrobium sp. LC103]
MRLTRKAEFRAGLAALALTISAIGMANAGSLYEDQVHADSFGNLVVYSSAGYKRILVGKGYAAESYNLTGSYHEPEILLYDAPPPQRRLRCSRYPVVLHGRSYMYGLPRNVVPVPTGICR